MISNNFTPRHNGVSKAIEEEKMLKEIGVSSMEELIDKAVPAAIRLKEPMPIADGINEYEFLNRVRALAQKNKVFKTYIGMGYYGTITPAVIQRNVFENAGWYTAYTPYQTEISQGRLEALMTYQTMVADMTHMPMANASLLGECMLMFFACRSRQAQKDGVNKIFVDNGVLPQTLDVMHTNAAPRNIEIVTGNVDDFDFDASKYFAVVVQNPSQFGEVRDYTDFIARCHEKGIFVGMATDLMALALVKTPGEMGADCAFGSSRVSAVLMQVSLPSPTPSSVPSPAVSSAGVSTPRATPPCAWLWVCVSSISSATRRPPISAPPRLCRPS